MAIRIARLVCKRQYMGIIRRMVEASQFDRILADVITQAVALYKGWPVEVE